MARTETEREKEASRANLSKARSEKDKENANDATLKDKIAISDERRKIAAEKLEETKEKNKAAIAAAWAKAAKDKKSSSNNNEDDNSKQQPSAGSDVTNVTKIIAGHVITVPVAKTKVLTAEQKAEQKKDRKNLRSLGQSIKNSSMKSLNSHINKYDENINADANKIAKAQESVMKNSKIQDSYQQFLQSKGGDVSKANENIKAIDQQVEKLNQQLAKSKSKSSKKELTKKIDSLNKDRAKDNAIISKFDGSKDYQSWFAKNKRASASIKNSNRIINNLKDRKAKNKAKMDVYKKEKTRQLNAIQKHQERVNGASIEKEIQNDINPYTGRQGHTYFYRADKKSKTLLKLYENNPTEQNQVNVPTKSIDEGLPLEHWAQNSGLTLSGQYDVVEDTYDERVAKYNILRKWSNNGVILVVRGFSTWHHVFITSVDRSVDPASNGNTLKLNINMQYARLAKIQTAKSTKGKKHKASASKKTGSHKSKKSTITIKPGMTYSQISAKTGVKVSTLEKNNPKYKAKSLPIGAKVEV